MLILIHSIFLFVSQISNAEFTLVQNVQENANLRSKISQSPDKVQVFSPPLLFGSPLSLAIQIQSCCLFFSYVVGIIKVNWFYLCFLLQKCGVLCISLQTICLCEYYIGHYWTIFLLLVPQFDLVLVMENIDSFFSASTYVNFVSDLPWRGL